MKERLLIYIKYLGINPSMFEKKTNLSNGFVGNIGASVREKSIQKISEVYPDLNINWWKTGEGNMLNLDSTTMQNIMQPNDQNCIVLSHVEIKKIILIFETSQKEKKELIEQLNECQKKLSVSQNQISTLLQMLHKK